MIFLGISFAAVCGTAAAGTALLTFLHFLKVRSPGVVVPSVMLWRDTEIRPLRRVLLEKLARLLSFLLPLIVILALCGALGEPVWDGGNAEKLVIVAEPAALPDAVRLLKKSDPLRSALIVASGSGVILHDFGAPGQPAVLPRRLVPAEPDAVSALAESMAGADGFVCLMGKNLPPWLPSRAVFFRSGSAAAGHKTPPRVKLALPGAPPRFRLAAHELPGVEIVSENGEPDLIFPVVPPPGASVEETELHIDRIRTFLLRSGLLCAESRQMPVKTPEARPLPRRGATALTGLLFALAFAALAADILLWRLRKTV